MLEDCPVGKLVETPDSQVETYPAKLREMEGRYMSDGLLLITSRTTSNNTVSGEINSC